MKPFYSLVNLSPSIATNDQVAIGMVLFNGSTFESYFSNRKKKAAYALLNDKNVNLNFIIKQIKEKCTSLNEELKDARLFNVVKQFTDGSYFNYLNSYSNGILQFSKPNLLSEKNGLVELEKMISFLFNETLLREVPEITQSNFNVQIEEKLIRRVEQKVHTHYKFNNANLPSIFFSYELDCIGQNGALIGAKSLSFDKSFDTLEKTVSHYYALISTLSANYNKNLLDNKFFLIVKEPESNSSKEHKLWESVKTNKVIAVVEPEESNQVADLIEQKKAGKFLAEVE